MITRAICSHIRHHHLTIKVRWFRILNFFVYFREKIKRVLWNFFQITITEWRAKKEIGAQRFLFIKLFITIKACIVMLISQCKKKLNKFLKLVFHTLMIKIFYSKTNSAQLIWIKTKQKPQFTWVWVHFFLEFWKI
jgi:hypothetical protein